MTTFTQLLRATVLLSILSLTQTAYATAWPGISTVVVGDHGEYIIIDHGQEHTILRDFGGQQGLTKYYKQQRGCTMQKRDILKLLYANTH